MRTKEIEILGERVLATVNVFTFKNKAGEWEESYVAPPWETHIKNGNFTAAKLALLRETLMAATTHSSLRLWGYDAPLAVSAQIPYGSYALHNGRIWLNEQWAEEHACDADGDRGVIHEETFHSVSGKKVRMGFLAKFPFTREIHPLTKIYREDIEENFYDFTESMAKFCISQQNVTKNGPGTYSIYGKKDDGTPEWELFEEEPMFRKAHQEVPVGMITNAWNTWDLLRTMRKQDFEAKVLGMFSNEKDPFIGSSRFEDIEKKTLKAVRKDGVEKQTCAILERKLAMSPSAAWAFIQKNKIPSMKNLDWMEDMSMQEFVANFSRIRRLKFRNPIQGEGDFYIMEDPKPKDRRIYQQGMGLWESLVALKLIRVSVRPNEHPDLPPTVIIWFANPKGEMCGLTDVKRNDRPEGLTYVFAIPPVYDNLNIYLKEDEGLPTERVVLNHRATHQFIRGDEFLAKLCLTVDNVIRRPDGYYNEETGKVVPGSLSKFWPEGFLARFLDPKYKVKLSMAQKAITEFAGRYGYAVPCEKDANGKLVFNDFSIPFVKDTVTVDYGCNATLDEMHATMKRIQAGPVKLCCTGSKSDDRRVRRYALANESGGAIWADARAHPARSGKQASQLTRALSRFTMKVAIVSSDTLTQAWVSPSGVEKQELKTAFMPKVYGSLEEFEEVITNQEAEYEALKERLDTLLKESEGKAGTIQGFFKTQRATERLKEAELTLAELQSLRDGYSYSTWTGEERKCWITGARSTIRVGKIVDKLGNKLFLAEMDDQATYSKFEEVKKGKKDKVVETLIPVDLVIPFSELVNKGCLEVFLDKCTQEEVTINGKKVLAMVGDFEFFRTGSGSENVQPRWRKAKYTGADSLEVVAGMIRCGMDYNWETDCGPEAKQFFKLAKVCAAKAAGASSPVL
jgi:hypothetical protein